LYSVASFALNLTKTLAQFTVLIRFNDKSAYFFGPPRIPSVAGFSATVWCTISDKRWCCCCYRLNGTKAAFRRPRLDVCLVMLMLAKIRRIGRTAESHDGRSNAYRKRN